MKRLSRSTIYAPPIALLSDEAAPFRMEEKQRKKTEQGKQRHCLQIADCSVLIVSSVTPLLKVDSGTPFSMAHTKKCGKIQNVGAILCFLSVVFEVIYLRCLKLHFPLQ